MPMLNSDDSVPNVDVARQLGADVFGRPIDLGLKYLSPGNTINGHAWGVQYRQKEKFVESRLTVWTPRNTTILK